MDELNNHISKVYELKNITDLCSNNGLSNPEFRFTEIKSLMRFWWRALNFYKSSNNVKKNDMKNEEEKIFGSLGSNSDRNSYCYKSPIIFKIKYSEFKNGDSTHIVGYRKNGKINGIPCYSPGKKVKFKLELCKRKINKQEYTNRELDFYDNLLKVSLILGGIGKRSRRGCGVFKIEEQNIQDNLKDQIQTCMENLNVSKWYEFSNEADNYFEIFRKEKYKNESEKYPYVEEIFISRTNVNMDDFIEMIRHAIDNTKNEKLQYKKFGKMACPVYVTCYGDQNELYPIIIKIHNTNPHETYTDYYKKFKEVILCHKE